MTDDELPAALVGLLPGACAARLAPVPRSIDDLYRLLPEGTPRLPRLYEELICRYEWHQAQDESDILQVSGFAFRLWSNAAASMAFQPLVRQMDQDRLLGQALVSAGWFPLAMGGRFSYDRVCFDLRRQQGRDCPVVVVDHEAVLSFDRVDVSAQIAPTFRAFCADAVRDTMAWRRGQRMPL